MTLLNIVMGFCFGLFLGLGCALAVMYSIYMGGYRKAIEDSLLNPLPERYSQLFRKARKHQ